MAVTVGNCSDPYRIEILDGAMVDVLRRKTAMERVAMVFDAEQTLLAMLGSHLQQSHPDWSQAQIGEEIARRRRLASS